MSPRGTGSSDEEENQRDAHAGLHQSPRLNHGGPGQASVDGCKMNSVTLALGVMYRKPSTVPGVYVRSSTKRTGELSQLKRDTNQPKRRQS